MNMKIGILVILLVGMITLAGCGQTEPLYPEEDPFGEEDPMAPEDPMLESHTTNNLDVQTDYVEKL